MAIISSTRNPHTLLPRFISAISSSTSPPLSPSAIKSLLLKEHDPDKTLSIISSLTNPSSSPASSRFAFDLAVRRLAISRRFNQVQSLLQNRISDPSSSQESFIATIILAYGSARMLDHAFSTFEQVPRLCSSPPTTQSFNALLTAAIRAKKHRKVRKIFSDVSDKHSISPDAVSYSILVKALCLSGKGVRAFETLREMEGKGLKPTRVVYATLIDFMYKKGEVEKAEDLWVEMIEKGCTPDLVCYNLRIMNKARHGSPEEVMGFFSEVEAAGLKPDEISYNYLMSCYCRNGRFEDVIEVYRGMKSKGCEPNAATFKIMLNFLCEKGDFDAAFDVFRDSVKRNRIPDFRTMRPFVEGLAKNLKVEEAKMVISVVKQRFPESLIGGWKVLEEELGLNSDRKVCDQVEAAES